MPGWPLAPVGHESEVGPATVPALAGDEPRDRLPALVLVGLWRHRQPGVIREHRDQSRRVALLHRAGEAANQFAFANRAGQRDALAITGRKARIERHANALQRALDRRFAGFEHLGDFGGAKAEHLAKHERRALAGL